MCQYFKSGGEEEDRKIQIQLATEIFNSDSTHKSPISPPSNPQSLAAQVFPGVFGNVEASEKRYNCYISREHKANLAV